MFGLGEWISWLFEQINGFFGSLFEKLFALIDIRAYIYSMLIEMANLLPTPNPDLFYYVQQAELAVRGLFAYIALFDYFINLRTLVLCIGIGIGIEAVLAVLRLWRMVRSTVI